MTADDVRQISRIRRLAANGEARAIRERGLISLREMAVWVGTGKDTLARWELGRQVPRGQAALTWAKILDELNSDLTGATL